MEGAAAADGEEPEQPAVASAVVVGVVIGVLLVLLLLVDLTCYAVNSRGITHALCSRGRGRAGDAKLSSLDDHADSEKEPLREEKTGNGAATDDSAIPTVLVEGPPAEEPKDSAV